MATFLHARTHLHSPAAQREMREAVLREFRWNPDGADHEAIQRRTLGMTTREATAFKCNLLSRPWNPASPMDASTYADWNIAIAEDYRCIRTMAQFCDPNSADSKRPILGQPAEFPPEFVTPAQRGQICAQCTRAAAWAFEVIIIGAFCGCTPCYHRKFAHAEAMGEWLSGFDVHFNNLPNLPGCKYCPQQIVEDDKEEEALSKRMYGHGQLTAADEEEDEDWKGPAPSPPPPASSRTASPAAPGGFSAPRCACAHDCLHVAAMTGCVGFACALVLSSACACTYNRVQLDGCRWRG